MIAVAANDSLVLHVFRRLSPERIAEMTATAWHDDPEPLVAELLGARAHLAGMGRPCPLYALLEDRGTCLWPPYAIVGVLAFGPGLGGMVWAATEQAPLAAVSNYRWWRHFFVPRVLCQFRRVEFTALAADTASRKWLKSLGFTEEGTAYRQGKRGEDFLHMAWLNPDQTVGVHA